MHIRAAHSADAPAACDVLRRSIAELCVRDHLNDEALLGPWLANKTPDNVRRWIDAGNVFVAEMKGKILGVAAVTEAGDITLNYVAPEARFKGVSKALIGVIEDRARELGCHVCTLHSTKTALQFYKAAGYDEQGDPSERVLVKALGPRGE